MLHSLAIGIDGCPDGWVAVVGSCTQLEINEVKIVKKLDELSQLFSDSTVVIDMPLILSNVYQRSCDKAAKEYLGHSFQASIFNAPPIDILNSKDYQSANHTCKKKYRSGLSIQSWNLFPKIIETRSCFQKFSNLYEGHPECSFKKMNKDNLLLASKKTTYGLIERMELLNKHNILPSSKHLSPELKNFKLDDLLDAASLYWTAYRMSRNLHSQIPVDIKKNDQGRIFF